MTFLYRLGITFLIVSLNSVLEAKSVIGPLRNNNRNEYDKADGVVKLHKNEFYDFNDQYERFLTDGSPEKSVHPIESIESTSPYTRERFLNETNMLDKSLEAVILSKALTSELVDNTPDTDINLLNSENSTELDRLLVKLDGDDGNSCLLDNIKSALLWWTFPNGTLRVSNLNITRKL